MKRQDLSSWNNKHVRFLDGENYPIMHVAQSTRFDAGTISYVWEAPEINPVGRGYTIDEWAELAPAALAIAQQWGADTGKQAMPPAGE